MLSKKLLHNVRLCMAAHPEYPDLGEIRFDIDLKFNLKLGNVELQTWTDSRLPLVMLMP